MTTRTAATALLIALAAVLGGCATAWEQHYRGTPAGVHERSGSVTLREVPWTRVDATLRAIEAERAASEIHPDEWPAERLEAEQAALLTGLQISEPPDEIEILGRSVFRSTTPLRPGDGSLASFARKLGADYAVWSSNYLGTKEIIEREPVHHTGFTHRTYIDHTGARRRDYVPWDRTVFVPVVIEADEYAWVVYYLRKR